MRNVSELAAEALRLSEAATAGPWRVETDGDDKRVVTTAPDKGLRQADLCVAAWAEWDDLGEADAEFIARARTLLPELARLVSEEEAND